MVTARSAVLDPTDREILDVLRERGRITWLELGRVVHLSANAVAERVRRLERAGIIKGYAAILDDAALGRGFHAYVDVVALPSVPREVLESWIRAEPTVTEALHLTGPCDYLLRLACRDAAELDDVLMRMKREVGVARTETRIVLRQV
jgi:Lrp/AsnC family transcriptional regulator, leucine-responsive regulatory protein